MFSETFRVRFSECDTEGKLTFPALVNFFQDVAGDHYYFAGYDFFRIRRMGFYWVILSWDIEVLQYPRADDTVTVNTFINRSNKNFCVRSFELKSKEGDVLARATSNWVICSAQTDRMACVPQELINAVTIDEYAPMKRMSLTFHAGEFALPPVSFPVTRHHLDLNGHINNVNYIRFLLDEVDKSASVKRLQIYYLAATREGETLSIFSRTEENKRVFQTKNQSGEVKTEACMMLM